MLIAAGAIAAMASRRRGTGARASQNGGSRRHLARASGHGPQTIAAPDLVATVPDEHADHRPSI